MDTPSEAWVSRLMQARLAGTRAAIPADEQAGLGTAEAIAIQDDMIARLGVPIAGWKIAVLPDGAAVAAPILADRLFHAPAAIPEPVFGLGGLECEIAFLMARAPRAPASGPFAASDVLPAIGGAMVAVEILDSRLASGLQSARNAMVADFLANAGLVVGEVVEDWHGRDLAQPSVALSINGLPVVAGKGTHVSGDLVGWVAALATHLAGRGRRIEPGQIVTTGSHSGVAFAQPGDTIGCVFDGWPAVRLEFWRGNGEPTGEGTNVGG